MQHLLHSTAVNMVGIFAEYRHSEDLRACARCQSERFANKQSQHLVINFENDAGMTMEEKDQLLDSYGVGKQLVIWAMKRKFPSSTWQSTRNSKRTLRSNGE
jgi:hypothetical protein